MARAIWSGSISFGMVSIPVKLFGATESKDISFNLLHATCGTRLQQRRWCPTDEVDVPWNETARGYEYAKGQYVVLTEEDFERLPLPSKHTIDLSAFVEEKEIDPVFYERSYYLEPAERAEKPYALLLKALEQRKLTAVATITIRKKEQLCAIRAHEGTIMLETLYYPDEIRTERGMNLSNVKVSDRELEMAFTLIDIFRKPFDPSEYQDHYREALAELIEAKLEGKEVVTAPAARESRVLDLADALKRSVEAAKKDAATAKPKPPARARTRAARSPRRTRKVG
ncbi:MAG TPA: Ku protein [Gemmatimonadales bacterium]|nr:Ku protein [Gemmatimonadales bacterium]